MIYNINVEINIDLFKKIILIRNEKGLTKASPLIYEKQRYKLLFVEFGH